MSESAWRVIVDDGTMHYFTSRVEADFFAKDTAEAGFTVRTSPVPLPENVRDFVAFLERHAEDLRHAETLLSRIEKVTPNWEAHRDLAEAVEVAIHHAPGNVNRVKLEAFEEMREALAALLPVAQQFEKQASHGTGGRRGGHVFCKARAALAKAKGAGG